MLDLIVLLVGSFQLLAERYTRHAIYAGKRKILMFSNTGNVSRVELARARAPSRVIHKRQVVDVDACSVPLTIKTCMKQKKI